MEDTDKNLESKWPAVVEQSKSARDASLRFKASLKTKQSVLSTAVQGLSTETFQFLDNNGIYATLLHQCDDYEELMFCSPALDSKPNHPLRNFQFKKVEFVAIKELQKN